MICLLVAIVDTDCVLLSIFTYTLLNLINLSVKSDTFPIKLNLMLSIDELSINFNEFRKLAIWVEHACHRWTFPVDIIKEMSAFAMKADDTEGRR